MAIPILKLILPKSLNRKEKSQAGSAHNWNTLFLGASAVADLMADKYGVSKGDVLSSDTQQGMIFQGT